MYVGTTLLKEEIVASITVEEDKLFFDVKLFNKFGTALQL